MSFVRITPIPEDQWGQVSSTSADPAAGTTTTGPVSEGQAAGEWWGHLPSLVANKLVEAARKQVAKGQPWPVDLWEYLTFVLLANAELVDNDDGSVVAFLRLKSLGLPGTPRHETVPLDQWVTYRSYQDFARRLIEGTAQLGGPVPMWSRPTWTARWGV